MRHGLIVLGLCAALVSSPAFASDREVSEGAALTAGAAGGASAALILSTMAVSDTIPHLLVAEAIVVGSYLEYTTDCTRRGLTNYVAADPMEERQNWECPAGGWCRRKCAVASQ